MGAISLAVPKTIIWMLTVCCYNTCVGVIAGAGPFTCDQALGVPIKLPSALLLWPSALTASVLSRCGGRRKNVSRFHKPKGSVARLSIRARLSSNETLCGGGRLIAGGASVNLPHLQACGFTQYLTDLWPMKNAQEWNSSHGMCL